ncbi:maestro heat-like repeat-containing protein family member 7 [Anas platyrhynchos]|uniref:maestro heat-like repeat-containing protein family member 7 n=1 Tax=Anas platyrhynchos TaxID=8839 RepID=UPI003AF2E02A
MDSLRTAFRQKAMETVALLSKTVPIVLHGKKKRLLRVCCKSIFFLPPESDVPETEGALFTETMKAMDTMLEAFVRNCPNTSFSSELENMLKVWHLQRISKESSQVSFADHCQPSNFSPRRRCCTLPTPKTQLCVREL